MRTVGPPSLPSVASELMTRSPLRVSPDDRLELADAVMKRLGVHHLPVVQEGRLVGMLSLRDVLAAGLSVHRSDESQRQRLLHATRVGQVMSTPVVSVTPATGVVTVAETLLRRRFSSLTVVDGEELVGIITETDLVRLAGDMLHREGMLLDSPPRVRRLMTPRPLFTAKLGDHLDVADVLMKHERFRHLPVVDERDRLIGMLSDRDVLGAMRSRLEAMTPAERLCDKASVAVADAMHPSPPATAPDALAEDAMYLMLRRRLDALPVVERGRLVGVLTTTDVLPYVAGCADRPGACAGVGAGLAARPSLL